MSCGSYENSSSETGNYDIVVWQGTDVTRCFTLIDADGLAMDLDGYSAHMQVRPSASSSTVISDRSTEAGTIEIAGFAVIVSWSHEETSAMPAGRAVYDIDLTDADGKVSRIIGGDFIVNQEVTR